MSLLSPAIEKEKMPLTTTKSLQSEISQLKSDLHRLRSQIVEKNTEISSKEEELRRRHEKKSAEISNSNMMQKLENVMAWAKRLENECTKTKRMRKQEERRIKLQLRRRNSFGEGDCIHLTRRDENNLLLAIPPVSNVSRSCDNFPSQRFTVQDFTIPLRDEHSNYSSKLHQPSKYIQSLQADIDELTAAIKNGRSIQENKVNQQNIIAKVHDDDMPLYMKRRSEPRPPIIQPSDNSTNFRRRYYALDDSATIADVIKPAPVRPRSEIHFNQDIISKKYVELPPIHSKFSKARSNRLHVLDEISQDMKKKGKKQVGPKSMKVKRLYGEPSPQKTLPKKNFAKLLSKSKKLEIQRKLRQLPIHQMR